MQRIVFGAWQPDQPAFLNEGLTVADGVFPIKNGYGPIGSFAPAGIAAVPTTSTGGAAYRVSSTIYSFVTDQANIYQISNGALTSLKSGLSNAQGVRTTTYSTLMLFTNGNDPIQKFTPAPTNAIANLGGSPPTARYITTVGGFTVLGYAAGLPTRVAWSNQGNPENWTISSSTEAGVLDLASGGDITGIVGGQYGLIFQENRVTRMTYTGNATVWQFDPLGQDIGCVVPGSLATWGQQSFFLSNRGFVRCDGSSLTPIGDEVINRWYNMVASRAYIDSVTSVIDPRNSLYIMAIPTSQPASRLLIYNYELDRWATATVTIERLLPSVSQPTNVDTSPLFALPDQMTISPDSAAFQGGQPILMVIDGNHNIGSLSGLPLTATLADAIREYTQGRRSRMRSVRLLTDAKAPTVTVLGQNAFGDVPQATTYSARRASGTYRIREAWNYAAMSVSLPSQPWTYIQGLDVDVVQGGRA